MCGSDKMFQVVSGEHNMLTAKTISVASDMFQAFEFLRRGHDFSLQSIGLELVIGVRVSKCSFRSFVSAGFQTLRGSEILQYAFQKHKNMLKGRRFGKCAVIKSLFESTRFQGRDASQGIA